MKSNYTPIWVILVAAAIIGILTLNVQQTYAPRNCPNCGEFRNLTHELEKSVIHAVGNPDTTPADIREMHKVWEDGVLRIFPPDPAILRLLEDYQQDVEKQFRQLTHAVATEVLTLAHEGFMDH